MSLDDFVPDDSSDEPDFEVGDRVVLEINTPTPYEGEVQDVSGDKVVVDWDAPRFPTTAYHADELTQQ